LQNWALLSSAHGCPVTWGHRAGSGYCACWGTKGFGHLS
jgi:hypothetical protein